jgi:hypothetical protein
LKTVAVVVLDNLWRLTVHGLQPAVRVARGGGMSIFRRSEQTIAGNAIAVADAFGGQSFDNVISDA